MKFSNAEDNTHYFPFYPSICDVSDLWREILYESEESDCSLQIIPKSFVIAKSVYNWTEEGIPQSSLQCKIQIHIMMLTMLLPPANKVEEI